MKATCRFSVKESARDGFSHGGAREYPRDWMDLCLISSNAYDWPLLNQRQVTLISTANIFDVIVMKDKSTAVLRCHIRQGLHVRPWHPDLELSTGISLRC